MSKCRLLPCDQTPKGKLYPMVHGFQDTVDRVIAGLNELQAGRGNQVALENWFQKDASNFDCPSSDTREPEDIGRILEYFELLNQLLFMGSFSLKSYSIRMVLSTGPTQGEREEVHKSSRGERQLGGTTEPQRNYKEKGTPAPRPHNICCNIRIFQIHDYSPVSRLRRYIGVLLHEMIHACLALFPCKCKHCHRRWFYMNPPDSNTYWYVEGVTLHGLSWFLIANKVAETCKKTLKLKVSLLRNRSLSHELDAGSAKWEVDYEAIGLTKRYYNSRDRDVSELSDASREDEEEREGYLPYYHNSEENDSDDDDEDLMEEDGFEEGHGEDEE